MRYEMQTSSSRRFTRPDVKQRTGCMSGFFHLLSRHHHNRSRKRLPSAGKKDKSTGSPAKTAPQPERTRPSPEKGIAGKDSNRAATPGMDCSGGEPRRRSSDTPLSPTLAPEIRRQGIPESPDRPRRPPALVARLMGLDEAPVGFPDSAAEKRRKLLGALEKCDEDLRVLKRIMESVRLAETRMWSAAAAGSAVGSVGALVVSRPDQAKNGVNQKYLDGGDSWMEAVNCFEYYSEQPSPVSVLDPLSSPRYRTNRSEKGEHHMKAWGTNENRPFLRWISIEGCPHVMDHRGVRTEGFGLSMRADASRQRWWGGGRKRRRRRRSKAVTESVVEVWEDGVWEERWEFGRVAVALEGEIFGDLVEEVVTEILGCFYRLSIPVGTCKKQLCF